jgi:hypothetical protein
LINKNKKKHATLTKTENALRLQKQEENNKNTAPVTAWNLGLRGLERNHLSTRS